MTMIWTEKSFLLLFNVIPVCISHCLRPALLQRFNTPFVSSSIAMSPLPLHPNFQRHPLCRNWRRKCNLCLTHSDSTSTLLYRVTDGRSLQDKFLKTAVARILYCIFLRL
uniref:Secreted protein n=1 Tax=Anguilla anguilla TaxID=7936 RepID=A0A0E9X4V6_ANGAN